MRLLLTCALLSFASGCSCGKPPLTQSSASLALAADALDFGPVPEGTSKGLKLRLDNAGRAPVALNLALAAGSSPDFHLGPAPLAVEAGAFVEVTVTFTPQGAGEDQGLIDITTDQPEDQLSVQLHGGPISPALTFDPEPLSFAPASSPLERRTAHLRSTGTSALTITAVGVSSTSNPDFSVVPPAALPAHLLPGEELPVAVEYAWSARTTEGSLEAVCDDADAGVRRLRLLPDSPAACANGLDDDGDGLIDFPSDPGCTSPDDDDEYNPAQCVNGGTQPCTGDGGCSGTRSCAASVWGPCQEVCDGGASSCNPNGLFHLDGGSISYACCLGLVSLNINQLQLQSDGQLVTPGPTQPGTTLTSSTPTTCPSGSFDVQQVLSGGCTETYRLQGTFVGPNSFVGTYTASFTGPDCTLCGGNQNCSDQTWNLSAGR